MSDSSLRGFVADYLRPHRLRLLVLAVLFVLGIGLQLANPQLARVFIDEASAGAPFDRLMGLAALFLLFAFATQIAVVAELAVAEDLGWRTTNALRADLTAHVLGLDDRFHADTGPGELLERIDGDVGAIAGFFARFVVQVLGSGLFLLGVLALLWREDWRIGLPLSAICVATVLFMTKGGRFVARRSHESRVVNGELSDFLEERLVGLVDIKANGADDVTMRGLHARLAQRFSTDRRSITAGSLFAAAANTALVAATIVGLAIAGWLHRSDQMTLGGLYVVFRYTTMLRVPLERLSRHLGAFQRAMGGIVRVRQLLTTRSGITDGTRRDLGDGPLRVAVDRIGFAYDHEPVLSGVSFSIEPGQTLGVVGRTGSGKTTIARMLFRLHDVDAGTVALNGIDVRELHGDTLRQRVAFVTQEVQLFSGTLRDNVRLFEPTIDDETIVAVFDTLGLGTWLAAFPDGLDTELGPAARGLSAGEAQLVSLARVFLRDPGLVILDEPSSRLDPETETLLASAMQRLLLGRTGVVIAHRLRTLERVDRVLVVEPGPDGGATVVEHGDRAVLAADPTSRFAGLLAGSEGGVGR